MLRVSMDIMTIEQSKSTRPHILIILNEYSKYAEAIPLLNQEATTIAKVFFRKWILRYGPPEELISDRGSNFLSKFFLHLCDLLNIRKITTAAYHPQGNRANECMQQRLYTILPSLIHQSETKWEPNLDLALFVYHTTYQQLLRTTSHHVLMGYKIAHMALIKPKHTSYEADHISNHPIINQLDQLRQLHETTFKNL